jgi:hypothetical protein
MKWRHKKNLNTILTFRLCTAISLYYRKLQSQKKIPDKIVFKKYKQLHNNYIVPLG